MIQINVNNVIYKKQRGRSAADILKCSCSLIALILIFLLRRWIIIILLHDIVITKVTPFYLGERQAVLAPPETEWYHGRLDRYTAEERLWKAANLGSYLGK